MFNHLTQIPPEQRWHEQPYPLPVVVALIKRPFAQNEHRYLLIHRTSRVHHGMWALVGGKWDFGETLPDAIVREVAEETGLVAQFVALRGTVSQRLAADNEKPAHFLLFVCELHAPDGIAEEQQEGEAAWFSHAEIEHLQANGRIIPTDYAMLQQFATATAPLHVEAEMVASLESGAHGRSILHRFEPVQPPHSHD